MNIENLRVKAINLLWSHLFYAFKVPIYHMTDGQFYGFFGFCRELTDFVFCVENEYWILYELGILSQADVDLFKSFIDQKADVAVLREIYEIFFGEGVIV